MAGDVTLGDLIRMLKNNIIPTKGFTGGTYASPTLTDPIFPETIVTGTSTTVTSTTAPVTIASSPVLTAGGTYMIDAHIPISSNAAGGAKVEIVGDGSLAASNVNVDAILYQGTTIGARTNLLGLGSVAGVTGAVTAIELFGSIAVSAAGSLKLQVAQNSSTSASTTAAQGAVFDIKRSS